MPRLPYMPVAVDALLADTAHLSMEEFGTLCMILFATWRNNGQPLPDDDKAMASLARVASRTAYAQLKPRLTPFFDLSTGYYRQGRLEKTWGLAKKKSEAQRKKAEGLWEAKRLKNNNVGDAAAYAVRDANKNIKFKKESLNISAGEKGKSGAAAVATATSSVRAKSLGPDEALWRMRLRWYRDDPSLWQGNWGPPPTDPRCWLLIAPDCVPYQPLLVEAGIPVPAEA